MTIPTGNAEFITTAAKPSGYPPPGPPEVAFAGRSNVGKSSLINTLTKRNKLVRVSGTPGRTQHINFFSIHHDTLRLVDLPGYGYAKVPMAVKAGWRPMVEAYLGGRDTLAAVVVILDIRREPTADDLMLLDWLRALQITILIAVTKADKLSNNQQASRLAKLKPALAPFDHSPTLFSATTRLGREKLWERICDAAGV
ncbi:MAG: ribosome biogenesis GTP-binding protein YihA/YsxC [Desulfarculus sp.]|nr:ribosome biogenesis GTP-binding protein YihA/YsxC [Desulfarculus sp.]MBV1738333.1 ribosome biogenesis GTP-binding protein YihA/YsxC [Desulfarculus sp.]MBV1750308.1 ribosome biogenesis GTP-binding protein YihA/YsxC [Desulfarculus sp.]